MVAPAMKTRMLLRFTALATLAALPGSALAEDWPLYHGAGSDRTSGETIANTDWAAKAPEKLWTAPTRNGFASFTVAGGKAYTIVEEEIDGLPTEVCIAFDADAGTTAWKAALDLWRVDHGGGNAGARGNDGGDGPRSTPAYAGGRVYCYTSDLRLVCLDAADGSERWAVEVGEAHGGRNIKWENAAAPLVEGGLVIVPGGGPGESFLAFDAGDGAVRWKSGDSLMTHASPVAATIGGRRQVLFFNQDGLTSVDANDGSQLWHHDFPFKVSTAAAPVVEGDIVYFAAGYGVGSTAIKVGAGGETEELWFSAGDKPVTNHWSTPLVKDGHLYGMFGFKEYGDGPLKCVELATGEVKWEHPGYGPGGVCLAGDVLVCLGDAGQLTLVKASPDGYQELSRIDGAISGKCWSAPVLANGKIYIRSTEEAACFDVR